MSIIFNPNVGQYGNQLFPTVLAHLLAYNNSLNIKSRTNALVEFKEFENKNILPTNYLSNKINFPKTVLVNKIELSQTFEHILPRKYYQDYSLFVPFKDLIKNKILHLPQVEQNTKDIVMHLRLDGFNHHGYDSHIISPEFYLQILQNETFEKLYIVMATKSGRIKQNQQQYKDIYLKEFEKFNPIFISNDEKTDFEFIRKFDKIICSNSTFAWWASFLSEASKVYIPKHFEGKNANLSNVGPNSIVVEQQYINIETMEIVPITFQ